MKKRTSRLSINRETLRRLDGDHLRLVAGATVLSANCGTIIQTQDSNCGCTGDPDSELQCEESNNSACELILC